MSRRPAIPDRTPSAHSRCVTHGVWCFERSFPNQHDQPPVRLVVFDWDETLTLSTFLPNDRDLRTSIGWNQWAEYITLHNFETPFVKSMGRTRVEKLQALFEDLRNLNGMYGDCGSRTLAILTRNNQGAVACLNLLMMAGLSEHFSAIWCMAKVPELPNSVYQGADGTWHTFTAPFDDVFDHKADVLQHVVANPVAWFPQFAGPENQSFKAEEIVLVDDVRNNFQSHSPERPRVVRYCKVARYDCHYREMGFKTDMGGIGARTDKDYSTLVDFVRNPWEYTAVLKARCMERYFDGCEQEPPVKLVVFDFDETLTLHTWMPEDTRFASEIGFLGTDADKVHFTEYNFASPYLEGNRIQELGKVLHALTVGDSDEDIKGRALAILTQNEAGAIEVLNLLMMAGLDTHFSAIWTTAGTPSGVWRNDSGDWQPFPLPFSSAEQLSKVDILKKIVRTPKTFFPQLRHTAADELHASLAGLLEMTMASIVLVDDEPANFQGEDGDEDSVVRLCEVTRYEDDNFRDQGLITHMGGLGAKRADDYVELLNFVSKPWLYREAQPPPQFPFDDEGQTKLERKNTQDELDLEKTIPSRRKYSMFSTP